MSYLHTKWLSEEEINKDKYNSKNKLNKFKKSNIQTYDESNNIDEN